VKDWLIAYVVPFERHGGTYAEKIVRSLGADIVVEWGNQVASERSGWLRYCRRAKRPTPIADSLPAGSAGGSSWTSPSRSGDLPTYPSASPDERRRRRHPEGRPD
jgi:hypothetical protein